MTTYLWTPPAPPSLPVHGSDAHMPVRRLFFVARNYHAHAAEMGSPVDKSTMRPAYFTKSPHALVPSGATIPYPPGTENFHYEMELVVALGAAGFRVPVEQAHTLVYGYAAGLDMTRRDLQQQARADGLPWSLAKDGELTAVSSAIVHMPGTILSVNVKPGQAVKKGEILVMLEAMKMENEIMAPVDGTVGAVNVTKGQSVQSGDVLVTIA